MLFTEIENHFLFLRYLHLKLQKHKGFYRKVQLQMRFLKNHLKCINSQNHDQDPKFSPVTAFGNTQGLTLADF